MENPSKIEEGGAIYSLGTFDGKKVFYDFPKILVYLEAKGKGLFGREFTLLQRDREILLKLGNYFIRDLENCDKDGIDPDILILQEVEDRASLLQFDQDFFQNWISLRSNNPMFQDNEPGGLKLAILSKKGYDIRSVQSHVNDRDEHG